MKKALFTGVIFLSLLYGVWALPALAQFGLADPLADSGQTSQTLGLATQDFRVVIGNVIRTVLGFLGIIAVGVVIYGGIKWMTSQGEENAILESKKIVYGGVTGLVIVLFSFAITTFILSAITGSGTGSGPGGGNGALSCSEKAIGTGLFCCPGFPANADPVASCSPLPSSFEVISVSPRNGSNNVVRNAVVMFRFNQPVNPRSVVPGVIEARKVEKDELIPGSIAVDPNDRSLVTFTPNGDCAPQPQFGNRCFPENTQIKVSIVTNGPSILSDDNKALNCSNQNCSTQFTVGTVIDTEFPTARFIKPEDGVLTEIASLISVEGKDVDGGFGDISFSLNNRDWFSPGAGPFSNIGIESPQGRQPPFVQIWGGSLITNGLAYGNQTLYALVRDIANHQRTVQLPFRLLPPTCLNNVQDGNETGVDCGGDCGACPGERCSSDTAPLCSNPNCSTSSFCNQACTCQLKPVITGVSTSFAPELIGAAGNFITLQGRGFGDQPGKVRFGGEEATAPNPRICSRYWSDTEIVVQVPSGPDDTEDSLEVETKAGGKDSTTDSRGPNLGKFTRDNKKIAPGLCAAQPGEGVANATPVTLVGANLGSSPANNLILFANEPINQSITDWTPTRIGGIQTPNLGSGPVSVQVKVGDTPSNIVTYKVQTIDQATQPVITGIDPLEASPGSYVTITGRGFGNSRDNKMVKLIPVSVDRNQQESQIETQSYNANLDFPATCANATWTDSQIVVKVPSNITFPNQTEPLEVAFSVWSKSTGGKRLSNEFGLPPQTPFKVKRGTAAPGLCFASPNSFSAENNVTINATGEQLGVGDVLLPGGRIVQTKTASETAISFETGTGNPPIIDGLFRVRIGGVQSNGLSLDVINKDEYPSPGSIFFQYRFQTNADPSSIEVVEYDCVNGRTGPTPSKGNLSVCRNALAGVAFDLHPVIDQASQGNKVMAAQVFSCGSEDPFKRENCNVIENVNYLNGPSTSSISTISGRILGSIDFALEGRQWAPNTWYAITLPSDPLKNRFVYQVRDYFIGLSQPYTWVFKTKTGDELCRIDSVNFEAPRTRIFTELEEVQKINFSSNTCQALIPPNGSQVITTSRHPQYFKIKSLGDIPSNSLDGDSSLACVVGNSTTCSLSKIRGIEETPKGTPGIHNVEYRSTDAAGQISLSSNQEVTVEKLPMLVIEDPNCSLQGASPSPSPGATNACRNAAFFLRFTLPVDKNSINAETLRLERRRSGTSNWELVNLSFPPHNQIDNARFKVDIFDTGIQITPPSSQLLDAGASYKVTLTNSIRTSLPGNSRLAGKIKNGIVTLSTSYTTDFTVSGEICELKSIGIAQSSQKLGLGSSDEFGKDVVGLALGRDCQILNPYGFNWSYKSKDDDGLLKLTRQAAVNFVRVRGFHDTETGFYQNNDSFKGGVEVAVSSSNGGRTLEEYDKVNIYSPWIERISPRDGSARDSIPTRITVFGQRLGQASHGRPLFRLDENGPRHREGTILNANLQCLNWTETAVVIDTPALAPDSFFGNINVSISLRKDPTSSATISEANWVPFTANTTIRPSLCRLIPDIGSPGDEVKVEGKNFGDQPTVLTGDGTQYIAPSTGNLSLPQ